MSDVQSTLFFKVFPNLGCFPSCISLIMMTLFSHNVMDYPDERPISKLLLPLADVVKEEDLNKKEVQGESLALKISRGASKFSKPQTNLPSFLSPQ